ncbi:MAG: tetratricopeptide repeat protein [Candidatus Gastranaerophilales bacterium]|nr:tetratricopeptide repeat protein [Candidatus Gastranaerophilales bacterium]
MKLNNFFKALIVLSILINTTSAATASIATDAKLQYNKGIDYYQLGQFEESASCFQKAIELDPNYIDAYYNLGSILEYLKQDEAALAVFKQIILRKPDDYESVYKAALLSKKVGEFEKAKMYLTLIPTDSLIGARAKQLADSMGTDIQTAKAEQSQPNSYQEANPQNNSDGMYNDIASPTGIVTDKNGNLYVAGFSDNTIYKIGADNKKIVYIKSEKIDGPIGLAIDTPGNIYIANYNKNNILKVDKNGAITELIENVQNPYCMYITGDLLFISSQGSNSVIRYKLNK